MYYVVIDRERRITYVFVTVKHLLKEVDICGGERRQIGLPILKKEVIQLLLRFHFGAELINVDLRICHRENVI